MVESDEAVRFAPAKTGLQLNDWVAALARQTHRSDTYQITEPVGDVSASKKGFRILILLVGLAMKHLVQICGELGLLKPTPHNIRMRSHNLPATAPNRLQAHPS